jgi:hypothetical protein
MDIQVDFGAAQTSIGYRFYDNTGAYVGSRVTSGINAAPQAGVYIASATVPSGAFGVYWDCADANFTASEDLTSARTGTAGRPFTVDSSGRTDVGSVAGTGQTARDLGAQLDVAVSTRNAVAPDNASVTAIKAKTDNLPAAPAAVSDIPASNISAIKAKTDNLPAIPAAADGNVNVTKINGTAVIGTGVTTDKWRA